jgi:hypothetical protein
VAIHRISFESAEAARRVLVAKKVTPSIREMCHERFDAHQ